MADKEREELLAIIADLTATVAKMSEELAESNRKISELSEALDARKRRNLISRFFVNDPASLSRESELEI